MKTAKAICLTCVFSLSFCFSNFAGAEDLINTIKSVKPAIVAVGTFQKTRSPAVIFIGTGFAVNDGLTIITNAHVVNSATKNPDEILGVLSGKGDASEFRPVTIVAVDDEHDLAQISISGTPLPTLKLGDATALNEGQKVAFTGFPLASALGFHPATHTGIISAITPVTMPAQNSRVLDAKVIAQLRRTAFSIIQLDATAYPGNSGSPMFDPETGVVIGVINMGMVKGLKESAITNPSGITYAIPVNFVTEILKRKL